MQSFTTFLTQDVNNCSQRFFRGLSWDYWFNASSIHQYVPTIIFEDISTAES